MERPLVWLRDRVNTPPFSRAGRREAGYQLRRLQLGEVLGMPQSRPMPVVGPRCHELRITDRGRTFRILYRTDPDAIVIVWVFVKKTEQTPVRVIEQCKRRLKEFDRA